MSVENPIPRKASVFDVRAIMTFAITGLLACFFLTYTAQIKMGEALLNATDIQEENIRVLRLHDSRLNKGSTWMRVTDIRLTIIEKELGMDAIMEKN